MGLGPRHAQVARLCHQSLEENRTPGRLACLGQWVDRLGCDRSLVMLLRAGWLRIMQVGSDMVVGLGGDRNKGWIHWTRPWPGRGQAMALFHRMQGGSPTWDSTANMGGHGRGIEGRSHQLVEHSRASTVAGMDPRAVHRA